MNERVALSIIIVEELSTIILHYGIHVWFNSRNFYFRDANGTSLKVSSLAVFIGNFFHYTNSYACIFYIDSTFTPTTNLLFFYRFPTLRYLLASLNFPCKASSAEVINIRFDCAKIPRSWSNPRRSFPPSTTGNYFVSRYKRGRAAFISRDRAHLGALIDDKIDTLANPRPNNWHYIKYSGCNAGTV